MVIQGYDTRKYFWLDVEGGWRGWIETPQRGADVSPSAWGSDVTLLNGGAGVHNSWGAHKRYVFEWSDSASRRDAQFMQSLAAGTYGRGLIHFIEPTLYDQNILPARWADPSMALGSEGAGLVYGVTPTAVPTANWETNLLPVRSVSYVLNAVPAGYRGPEDSLYISIPEGYTLFLGAFYTSTGTGGLFVSPVNDAGAVGTPIRLPETGNTSATFNLDGAFTGRGVRLWAGKSANGSASVTVSGIVGHLIPTQAFQDYEYGYGEGPYGGGPYGGYTDAQIPFLEAHWSGGMGHSGVRFVGKPTLQLNTGMGAPDGGPSVSYAATFAEVGSWLYG